MKKTNNLLIEKDMELPNLAVTEYYWNMIGDIARLPIEAILLLQKHLLTVIFREKGEEAIVALQEGVTKFLYPDPKMLSWAEARLKRKPEMTPSELAYQYAKVALNNRRMGPSLIRDMQKLKTRVQMRNKREAWARMSGRKINKRMERPKPRIPANAAYFEKVVASRLNGKGETA